MQTIKKYWFLIIFNLIYTVGFAAYYIKIANYEFLWYVGVLVFFLILILATLHRTKSDGLILWGLSLWGLFHMAGGGLPVGDGVLYQLPLIHLFGEGDSLVFKFDQFVHLFGFGVATLLFFHLLKGSLAPSPRWGVIYFLFILGGMGFGALNEIVEYIAVLTFPETGVGGYDNTMLDIVFNTIGAIIETVVIALRRQRPMAFKQSGFGFFALIIGVAIMALMTYYALDLFERPPRPPVGSEEEELLNEVGAAPGLPGMFGAIDAAKDARTQVESRY